MKASKYLVVWALFPLVACSGLQPTGSVQDDVYFSTKAAEAAGRVDYDPDFSYVTTDPLAEKLPGQMEADIAETDGYQRQEPGYNNRFNPMWVPPTLMAPNYQLGMYYFWGSGSFSYSPFYSWNYMRPSWCSFNSPWMDQSYYNPYWGGSGWGNTGFNYYSPYFGNSFFYPQYNYGWNNWNNFYYSPGGSSGTGSTRTRVYAPRTNGSLFSTTPPSRNNQQAIIYNQPLAPNPVTTTPRTQPSTTQGSGQGSTHTNATGGDGNTGNGSPANNNSTPGYQFHNPYNSGGLQYQPANTPNQPGNTGGNYRTPDQNRGSWSVPTQSAPRSIPTPRSSGGGSTRGPR